MGWCVYLFVIRLGVGCCCVLCGSVLRGGGGGVEQVDFCDVFCCNGF